MARTTFHEIPVDTRGDLPAVGSAAPPFILVANDLSLIKLEEMAGRTVVLNIFPSLDTEVCANTVRTFNLEATKLGNTNVLGVSMDLPFAGKRFCGNHNIEHVALASAFRSRGFLADYGVEMINGPLTGLCARAIVVIDPDGNVAHTELVEQITSEPDYDAALAFCS